jgi:hypothetical protein
MRKWIAMLIGCGMLSGAVAHAGGSARIVGLQTPHEVKAGASFQLSFAVQPVFPSHRRNVEPVVTASSGGRTLTFEAKAVKGKDQYAAAVSLPEAGDWTIRVDSHFCQTLMDPVTVRARAAKS